MCFGVVMTEGEAAAEIHESGCCADEQAGYGNQLGKTIRHFANRILIAEWRESQNGLKRSP